MVENESQSLLYTADLQIQSYLVKCPVFLAEIPVLLSYASALGEAACEHCEDAPLETQWPAFGSFPE